MSPLLEPLPGAERRGERMNCPTCGAGLVPGAKFCGACGTTVSAEPVQSQPQPQYQTSSGGGGGIRIDDDARGEGRGYSYEVLHQPAFALAVVRLQAEQSILAEAGAMVSMSANVELQSQMKGGLMGALKRAVGGESAFISTFTARGGPGEVCLAPSSPGDVQVLNLNNQAFFIQGGSFLAAAPTINIDTKLGGAKSFFSGEGLFLI